MGLERDPGTGHDMARPVEGAYQGKALFDSVIVVTDRRALDQQIRDTIEQFAQGLFTLFSPRLPESVLRSGKAEGARCSCAA